VKTEGPTKRRATPTPVRLRATQTPGGACRQIALQVKGGSTAPQGFQCNRLSIVARMTKNLGRAARWSIRRARPDLRAKSYCAHRPAPRSPNSEASIVNDRETGDWSLIQRGPIPRSKSASHGAESLGPAGGTGIFSLARTQRETRPGVEQPTIFTKRCQRIMV